MRICTPASSRPDFSRQSSSSAVPGSTPVGGWAMPPTGEVSVMPQPWMIRTPYCFSNVSISDLGIAAPPEVPIRMDDRSSSRCAPSWARPPQIVGTADTTVARSASTASAQSDGVMCGPGKIKVEPDRNAPNGIPQALTWNIGTMQSIRSVSSHPVAARDSVPMACRNVERWEYTTPFGSPVVPLV